MKKIYLLMYNTIKFILIVGFLAIIAWSLGMKHSKEKGINKEGVPKIQIIKKFKQTTLKAYNLGKLEEVQTMLSNLYPTLYKGKNKKVMEKIYLKTHSLIAIEMSKKIKRDRRY